MENRAGITHGVGIVWGSRGEVFALCELRARPLAERWWRRSQRTEFAEIQPKHVLLAILVKNTG